MDLVSARCELIPFSRFRKWHFEVIRIRLLELFGSASTLIAVKIRLPVRLRIGRTGQ